MFPWNGIHVPTSNSAVIGSLTGIPSVSRNPPPAAPVANSDVTMTQKSATSVVATNGLLCEECVRPTMLGRIRSRPIENR